MPCSLIMTVQEALLPKRARGMLTISLKLQMDEETDKVFVASSAWLTVFRETAVQKRRQSYEATGPYGSPHLLISKISHFLS